MSSYGRLLRLRTFLQTTLLTTLLTSALTLPSLAQAEGVALKAFGQMDKYHADHYSDSWGYTAPDGREYALVGVRTGTSIVDITEPSLKEVAFIPGKKSTWKEIKTFKSFAYIATDNAPDAGLQIIDLSDLPRSAKLVNTYMAVPQSHDLWVDDAQSALYLVGGDNNSVTVLDLKNPVHPAEITTFGAPVYVHDIFVRNGRAFLSEILTATVAIYDVKDLTHPKLLKRLKIPNAPDISAHNAWPTEDGNYLITTEETEGQTVKIWDIRDLSKIKLVAEYLGPNKLAHNVYIKGHYAYLSHYGAGLRILDIADPTHPVDVAHFDKGDPTLPGFVAAWGAYPFFKSGKVLVSDIEDGLFVVQFDGAKEKSKE